MATSPTAKEVSVDLAGFKSSVDQQFKSLRDDIDKRLDIIVKLIFAMFALFPIIVGGGFLLRSDLGEVKVELVKLGDQISTLHEEGRARVSDPQIAQISSAIRRIEDKLNTVPPVALVLTDDEKNLIRLYFKMDKGPSKGTAKYSVGDVITAAKDIPSDLVQKISKLKGLKVAFDPGNGSALIVAFDNRIVAIVEQA